MFGARAGHASGDAPWCAVIELGGGGPQIAETGWSTVRRVDDCGRYELRKQMRERFPSGVVAGRRINQSIVMHFGLDRCDEIPRISCQCEDGRDREAEAA
jgi:hypothetical protein